MASYGLPGYEATGTYGIFVPARTPAALIGRLNQEIVSALKYPDAREKYYRAGMETIAGSPEDLAAVVRSEITVMGKVIRDAGIRDQ